MKIKNTLLAALSLLSVAGYSQVPKKVVVEHFTNSRCSICASRNPGFLNNFNSSNTGDMIHLAIHPSSPYSTCVFNQHNSTENDARTNYYGIYGATPRLVINGNVIPSSSSYNSPSLFTPYKGETTPISLDLTQSYVGLDEIHVRVAVRVESTHSLSAQNLYVVLAEDTIFYNAPNGENEHYDVFRSSFFGSTGTTVNLPAMVGDSVIIEGTLPISSDWVQERMFVMAILQDDASKEVTQSAALTAIGQNPGVTGIASFDSENVFNVFPNPVNEVLNIALDQNEKGQVKITSISGKIVYTDTFESKTVIATNSFQNGVYFISVTTSNGIFTKRIIKLD